MAPFVLRGARARQAARSAGTVHAGQAMAIPSGPVDTPVAAWQTICNAARHATQAHAEERGARILRIRDRRSGSVLQPAAAVLAAAGEAPHACRVRGRGDGLPARAATHARDGVLVRV